MINDEGLRFRVRGCCRLEGVALPVDVYPPAKLLPVMPAIGWSKCDDRQWFVQVITLSGSSGDDRERLILANDACHGFLRGMTVKSGCCKQ